MRLSKRYLNYTDCKNVPDYKFMIYILVVFATDMTLCVFEQSLFVFDASNIARPKWGAKRSPSLLAASAEGHARFA
jgi:hypothetical protein